MNHNHVWMESDFRPTGRFQTGVSLHGHTLHSRESLSFLYPLAKRLPPVHWLLKQGEAHYAKFHNLPLDLSQAWWTPPLAAYDAWSLETRQIQDKFGLQSLVSLSDHDDIEAPMTLQVLDECRSVPVSAEWTVPYDATFFHIGVHNIAAERARSMMTELAKVTDGTADFSLEEIFKELASDSKTLIVFNHPNWDESGIGAKAHRALARQFVAAYHPYLHAFELNGLRPWKENRSVLDLAHDFQKPLISGGDRHGMEPNVILNLTNAATFDEFADEVRAGFSNVFVTKQYLEPFSMRILQNVEDVLSEQDSHPHGWKHWSDRTFYICEDGVTRSLSEAWGQEPASIRLFTRGLELLRSPQFKNAFRVAFARREEVAL